MKIIKRIIKRLKNKTFVEAIKNQPGKIKRNKWQKIVNSGATYYLFNYKNYFKINLPIDSELSQYIYQNIFEKNELNFVSNYLKKGDIFIDIGTNIGLYSLLAASKTGDTGRVYSFEPVRKTYDRLLDNIKLNDFKNITPIKKAISENIGKQEIHTSTEGFDAWNSFTLPVVGSNYNIEIVDTITIDEFFTENNCFDRTKLIKIDVEGWEKFVILGGKQYLSKNNSPALMIEFEETHTKNAGYQCKELYHILTSYGYKIYRLKNNKLIEQPILEHFPSCNLIAKKAQ